MEDKNPFEEARNQVLTQKELFIEKLSPDIQPIVEHRLKQKERWKQDKKERSRSLAEVTKSLVEDTFVTFDDDGVDLTINELLVSRATANLLNNEKITFKDLNEVQKVIDNDTAKSVGGLTIVVNTNGQDLGE